MRRVRCIALLAVMAAGGFALSDDERHVSLVPWKVIEPGESVEAPLVLYWVPSSREELRRSPLLTSNALTLYSSRCVAMRVVRVDDGTRLAKLHVEGELPVAVLADGTGRVIATVDAERGTLSVREVEELVREELETRMASADTLLDEARRRLVEGDVAAAEELYREVWDARCLCPRQGKVAQKALRRLVRK
jgi:type IV secretory pathway protease TraF